MSSIWGNRIKISIFGESHSQAIGGVFDGLPSGIELDMDFIQEEMKRRAPGNSPFSTPRKEKDVPEILSGYFNGYTTGTPLAFIIKNTNNHSKDYDVLKDIMRPSHGDFTGRSRYNGYNDHRGGGHFSGRLTAPLVFMGAIAKNYISNFGVKIFSRIKSIGTYEDENLPLDKEWSQEQKDSIKTNTLPTINKEKSLEMEKCIIEAKNRGDSVGGVIQCMCDFIPVGLGFPFFQSVESSLSQLLFSIPGVKGVEFGTGFDITKINGSVANDQMYWEDGEVLTRTNHNGGLLGGITNGMPITFNVAIKPTPSIASPQETVNMKTMKNEQIQITGRHDPCIVPRALPVVESCAALVIMDLILQMEGIE